MLFRFGLIRNLTFVIPNNGPYFRWGRILLPRLALTMIFFQFTHFIRKNVFDKVLPKDRVNIGIVRDLSVTVSQSPIITETNFRNTTHIWNEYKNQILSKNYCYTQKNMKSDCFHTQKNAMAKDFGFDENTKQTDMFKINKKLNSLYKEFQLVMTMERFHESLVLLSRSLNWSMEDISLLPTNSHKQVIVNVTEEEILKHKQTCFLDYAIYDFFSKKVNKC